MKLEDLARAIADIREARDIHAIWARYVADGGGQSKEYLHDVEIAGGEEWHRAWIEKYDRVLEILEGADVARLMALQILLLSVLDRADMSDSLRGMIEAVVYQNRSDQPVAETEPAANPAEPIKVIAIGYKQDFDAWMSDQRQFSAYARIYHLDTLDDIVKIHGLVLRPGVDRIECVGYQSAAHQALLKDTAARFLDDPMMRTRVLTKLLVRARDYLEADSIGVPEVDRLLADINSTIHTEETSAS
jgi:hypothetical protein